MTEPSKRHRRKLREIKGGRRILKGDGSFKISGALVGNRQGFRLVQGGQAERDE